MGFLIHVYLLDVPCPRPSTACMENVLQYQWFFFEILLNCGCQSQGDNPRAWQIVAHVLKNIGIMSH